MRAVVPLRTDVELRRDDGARDDAAADELAAAHSIESPVGRLRTAIDEVLLAASADMAGHPRDD
jgi:hypothetical protein